MAISTASTPRSPLFERSTSHVRILWTEEHKIDFVGLTSGQGVFSVAYAPLAYAEHEELGDVARDLSRAGSLLVPLAQNDIVLLGFNAPPEIEGAQRDFVFVTAGSWTRAGDSARHFAVAPPSDATMRVVGARPALGLVTMRVQLPQRAEAALRIFDVQGRLVRTLLDGPLDAGLHLATWDLRDRGNRRAARGVYFARLEVAGSRPMVEKIHVLR